VTRAVHITLAWLLEVAQTLPGDPLVIDFGVPAAAEARHRATILDQDVYAEPHHKAAALLCTLARNPALEQRNLLYAATVCASYLGACGTPVRHDRLDAVVPLTRAAAEGASVRDVAAQLKFWTT
jgi:hypothetical protein